MATLPVPGLKLAFTVHAKLSPAMDVGLVEGVRKRIIPILGGTVDGPRLAGVVVEGGADWQDVGPDGVARIFARYTLKAEDGTLISVINPGVRRGPPEVIAALARGDEVDPSQYYFRTTPRFEVADGPHGWLTRSAFVCVGARFPAGVEICFYEVT